MAYFPARKRLPVAKEGFPFIAGALFLTLLAALGQLGILTAFFALLVCFTVYFFRDPERPLPNDPDALVAPADGRILKIETLSPAQSPLGIDTIKVSIFMSVFNVHVNRSPAEGTVEKITYEPGKFFSANLDKASTLNEKNRIFLYNPVLGKILLIQIAGLIARRIVCWIQAGQRISRGQRLGLIRFGSRVELFLPSACKIVVNAGQKVKAGQTIIGYTS